MTEKEISKAVVETAIEVHRTNRVFEEQVLTFLRQLDLKLAGARRPQAPITRPDPRARYDAPVMNTSPPLRPCAPAPLR